MLEEWKKELTDIERELLNFIYSYWKSSDHWPENNEIKIALKYIFKDGVNLNSIGTSENSLNGYFIHYYDQAEVTSLLPLGIALCDNSEEDVELFLKIVRFFAEKYNHDYQNYKNVIYVKDFPSKYFNSDDKIKSFCKFFLRETPQLFHFTGTGCNFRLDNKIINLEDVSTMHEYYAKIYHNAIPPRFNQNSSKIVEVEPKRRILEILYDHAKHNPYGSGLSNHELQNELNIDDNKLFFNISYLENDNYIEVVHNFDGFFVKINNRGRDIIEDNSLFNNLFPPISVTQNIIQNSSNVIINSNHASINIDESFNQIYNRIDEENVQNMEEIKEALKNIEEEFKNDCISKSEIQASLSTIDLLKGNAYWIIPMILQLITSILLYKP